MARAHYPSGPATEVAATSAAPDPFRGQVGVIEAWLRCAAERVHEHRIWLTDLDAAIGDGDHGINMDRGFTALVADLDAGALPTDGIGRLLAAAGRRLLGNVGGASGALYGRGLMAAGDRIGGGSIDADAGGRTLLELALAAAVDGVAALGRSGPGDKTMLDALVPALAAIRATAPAMPVAQVVALAAGAAEAGAAGTIPMVARRGRASYLGERAAGHLDPGAASSAILVRALADVLAAVESGAEHEPRRREGPTRP